MKTADRTVVHNLGLEACGGGANMVAADVKDDKIVRIRPMSFEGDYTKEDLNYWVLKGRDGKTFEPGMKTPTPPFPLVYKRRTYSKNRIPFPMKRIDWDPNGNRNQQNRGTSKYVRISWDKACELIASEIKRVHDEYGPYSILCQADGHGESKAVHCCHGCQTMLLDLCGGYTVQARNPDSWEGWYWGAKHAWGMDPVGQNTFSTNTAQDIAQNADAMLYWGCDLETNTSAWGGQLASKLAFWFDDCGVKHIAIAPDANYTAVVHADKRIPVLPNTDAALQFHRIVAEPDGKTVVVPMKDPYYLEIGFVAKREVMESPFAKSLFARLNAYYSKFASSPYISLVPSAIALLGSGAPSMPQTEGEVRAAMVSRYKLSQREGEILSLLLEGKTARPIADALMVGTATAKSHIYSIYKKVGVHSQKELIAIAEGIAEGE